MPTREVIRPPYIIPPADVSRPIHQLGSQLGGAVVVQGAGVIQTHDYVAATSGWYISPDTVEFNDGTFRGALAASSIDIGGSDADSWHVDADGNMWWGADGSYAAASIRISSTGVVDFTTGTWSGAIEASAIDIGGADATSWHVDSDGNMWWGSAGSHAAASIKISSTGVAILAGATLTTATVTGEINATTGTLTDLDIDGDITITSGGVIRSGTSGQRTEFIPGTTSINGGDLSGLLVYSGNADETGPASVGVYANGRLILRGAEDTTGTGSDGPGYIQIGSNFGAQAAFNEYYADRHRFWPVTGAGFDTTIELDGDFYVDGNIHFGTNGVSNDYLTYDSSALSIFLDGDERYQFSNAGQFRIDSRASGYSTLSDMDDGSRAGIFLTADNMNTTSKYTPGIVFGSRDSDFTTENPKALAGIFGFATEAYSSDSDGGMGLEIVTPTINPGAGGVLPTNARGFFMQGSGFHPRVDDTQDLGTSSLRWDDVYATNGTIQTSDARDKTMHPEHELGLDFMLKLPGAAFTRTGGTRIHHGTTAQALARALRSVGADPAEHALYIAPPKGRKGVRYGELWGPQLNANRELHERLAAIEEKLGLRS